MNSGKEKYEELLGEIFDSAFDSEKKHQLNVLLSQIRTLGFYEIFLSLDIKKLFSIYDNIRNDTIKHNVIQGAVV